MNSPNGSNLRGKRPDHGRGALRFAVVACGLTLFLGHGHQELLSAAEPGEPFPMMRKKPSATELLRRFPFVSLEGRLAYETLGKATAQQARPPQLPSETAERLRTLENQLGAQLRGNTRVAALRMLHSSKVKQFINADGFGYGRMGGSGIPTPRALPLSPTESIPFPAIAANWKPGEREMLPKDDKAAGKDARLPTRTLLDDLHQKGRANFLDIDSFGLVVDRKHVSGFRSHQFGHMPELSRPRKEGENLPEASWVVRRLELVSLLRHAKAVVYISDQLPQMKNLRKAPTRPLKDHEAQALKELRQGEDVVMEAHTNRIRMVGSLRATRQCLSCHHGKRGDLLGAFSYELHRDPPIVSKK